jgi:hypothetical protein
VKINIIPYVFIFQRHAHYGRIVSSLNIPGIGHLANTTTQIRKGFLMLHHPPPEAERPTLLALADPDECDSTFCCVAIRYEK